MSDWRYMVTIEPGVSIGPSRYVRIVDVDGPDPSKAAQKALAQLDKEDTQLWQSDDVTIRVERVA